MQGAELCVPACSPGHSHTDITKDKVTWGEPSGWRAEASRCQGCRAGYSRGYEQGPRQTGNIPPRQSPFSVMDMPRNKVVVETKVIPGTARCCTPCPPTTSGKESCWDSHPPNFYIQIYKKADHSKWAVPQDICGLICREASFLVNLNTVA